MADLLTDLKKALINPEEDFVTMINTDEAEKTRVITEDELNKIREETDPVEDEIEEEDEEEDETDDKVNPKMEKAITIMGIVAAVIIAAIVIYIIGSFFGLFKFGSSKSDDTETTTEATEQVEVPNLLGMTEDEAKEALEDAGLGYKNIGTASSDEYEEGLVMDQSVNAGKKVDKNTTIKVTFSSGKGDIDIPDVTGMTESNAISTLKSAGFKYNTNYEYSDDVESGKVISYSPTGEGQEGDTITITVSQGKETVQVPDVKGKSQSDAESALSALGLSASVTTEYSDTVAEGNVISQGTSAGTYVTKGSSVSITVSKGAEAKTYTASVDISADYAGGSYVLTDSNGKTVASGNIASSGSTVSASGITTSSGTLTITDANGNVTTQSVSFKEQ
jgi:serine/threonine-protein kinase